MQDVSDAQYHSFRSNVPYLALLLIFHPILRRLYDTFRPVPSRSNSPKPNGNSYISAAEGEAHLEQRASFDFGFAFIFLAALHGFSALKIVIILYINYCIATQLPRKYIPAATWIFNICTLFANELSEGYKFEKMAQFISPLEGVGLNSTSLLHTWGSWLDSYGGIISRWEIQFNLTVLRLISFNLDYYWSLGRRGGSPIEVCCHVWIVSELLLMLTRRNNWTLRTFQNGIVFRSQRVRRTIHSGITLHTPSTHLCILQDLF
jgi:membrane-bound O-acyltransferase GUP1_2